MSVILENERLRVEISLHGAEITSIWNKVTNRECVWNGDAAWWKRHTPILFPIVGSLWQGTMRHHGVEYHMSQHGFARDMDFVCISADGSSATFMLKSNDDTRGLYPFDFELYLTHSIDADTVKTTWRVVNPSNDELHFQIGGHPAYMIPDIDANDPVSGYVSLEHPADYRFTHVAEGGCVAPGYTTKHVDEIPLKPETFAGDAWIFESPCPARMDLLDCDHQPVLTFESDCPALGIWQPRKDGARAPFVCLEPWWGRADRVGYQGEYSEREYVQHLAPGSETSGAYMVTFHK